MALRSNVRLASTVITENDMTITQLIAALEALKEKHGDIDVTVWQYGGGLDDLCDVEPKFSDDTGTVVLETTCHDSGMRR